MIQSPSFPATDVMIEKLKLGNILILLAFFVASSFCGISDAETVSTCPGETTLEDLVECLEDSENMPGSGSNAFVVPTSDERNDWALVVKDLLDGSKVGSCPSNPLPDTLADFYELVEFVDSENSQNYCILAEQPSDSFTKKAWGTFIVAMESIRELAIQIPHPLFDSGTPEQGIAVFKESGARSFLMAGSHRHANSIGSMCQSNFEQADVAHNTENMFHPTHQKIHEWYQSHQMEEELRVLQFHGMGESSCGDVDVYLTYGLAPAAGNPEVDEDLVALKTELSQRHPEWKIVVPGDSTTCSLHGTTNVQGRLSNGVSSDDVCNLASPSYSGAFIHVEQKIGMRDAADWVEAIKATWHSSTQVFADGFESGDTSAWSM